MNNKFESIINNLQEPDKIGSYSRDDVIFVLKDIANLVFETSTKERENRIQSGGHYSEMLPIEYKPSDEYTKLFYETLEKTSNKVAKATAIVSDNIIKRTGNDVVLVSLARAGTPVGVLVKRYIKHKYKLNLNHYSISIIRDRGIDEKAIAYILKENPGKKIQFIDGWTGKGVIKTVLKEAVEDLYNKYDIKLEDDLAVLADPAYCVSNFGTREDFLIPSACLNSTVSGLVSRTFLREGVIGKFDFHGAKYYKEWTDIDISNYFVDEISKHFPSISKMELKTEEKPKILNSGLKDANRIRELFDINDINLIKPGVGETTRVLLRRVPWKILVKDLKDENIKHILLLAKEKNVPVEEFHDMSYSVCGLIQQKGEKRGEIQ